jgi:hypothetical protein
MTNVRTVINEWFRLAVERHPDDPFFSFIALWIAFNAHYISRYHFDRDARVSDHKYVRRFAQEAAHVQHHRRLLANDDYHDAVGILTQHGVQDIISGKRYEITRTEDLLAVLETVYQVRCNLFHGGKLRDDPRDLQLTAAAFVIVKHLLLPIVT